MRLLRCLILATLSSSGAAFIVTRCTPTFKYDDSRLSLLSSKRQVRNRGAPTVSLESGHRKTYSTRPSFALREQASRGAATPSTGACDVGRSAAGADDGTSQATRNRSYSKEQDEGVMVQEYQHQQLIQGDSGETPLSAPSLSQKKNHLSPSFVPLALLNTVTVLWGTQHAVIKLILQGDLSPGVTNFARFGIAAVLFSPWTPGVLRDPPPLPFSSSAQDEDIVDVLDAGVAEAVNDDMDSDVAADGASNDGAALQTWRAGAELGMWMFLGFAFQSIGLGFTSASAFLLYLNVKLVPFFAYLLEGRNISGATWISAFLAFVGTVLLSSDGTPPNVGDLWSVLAAATSAMFILRLEKYSGSCDASRLNSANLWVTMGLCGLWAAWEVTAGGIDGSAALEGLRSQGALIGYLAVVTTALTNWMQALGQRSVPAERAAVIYAMDPVYAAGFAYLLLGETLGPAGFAGATVITGAALWSQGQQTSADGGKD